MWVTKLSFYVYVITLCLFVGLIRYKRLSPRFLQLFVPLLFVVLFAELATPLKLIRFKGSNHWLFNLVTILEFVFYFFIFSLALRKPVEKKIALLSIPFYLLIATLNIFLFQGFNKFHTISYRLGAVMVITGCLLYFRQLLRTDEQIILLGDAMFWICTGLLFFYLGFFFYISAFDYIVYSNLPFNRELWKIISHSLNFLLYSCFIISFLCRRATNR